MATSTINLENASVEQTREFLDSFDIILSDCDGVLWYLDKPIPGSAHTLRKLRDLGKKLYLISNNSTITIDEYRKRLDLYGLDIKAKEIINTAKTISWYLKKIKFTGEAFVIATTQFRQVLIDDGFKLVPQEKTQILEHKRYEGLKSIEDDPAIKAVIVDFCFLCDWTRLALAISCLDRKDVYYICGCREEWLVYRGNKRILGSGPLIDLISRQSGRTPLEFAKPSENLKDYVFDIWNVKDPGRCLMIGDSINTDMKFGAMCGFKKLFVNTGADKIDEAALSNECCPDFYIPSLALLSPLIDSLQKESAN
ncbi:4-nitrophenylphosphatase-like [Bombus pyrosoma]|uniref:4-nitrophenylphosphatase-like n=1 Tax=Bombus pyrosoma TaxID=396416 RepID=UPI001CB94C31|nr:4-nitrophenylphosphatase-like [Bombus pyrosoma]